MATHDVVNAQVAAWPTWANDNVLMLPDDFTDQDFLFEALEALLAWIAKSANNLVTNALERKYATTHDPLRCAERYMNELSIFILLDDSCLKTLDSLLLRTFLPKSHLI